MHHARMSREMRLLVTFPLSAVFQELLLEGLAFLIEREPFLGCQARRVDLGFERRYLPFEVGAFSRRESPANLQNSAQFVDVSGLLQVMIDPRVLRGRCVSLAVV